MKTLRQEQEREDLKVQLARREVDFRKAKRKVEQINETTSSVESRKMKLDLQITEQDYALYQEKMDHFDTKSSMTLSVKAREKQYLPGRD